MSENMELPRSGDNSAQDVVFFSPEMLKLVENKQRRMMEIMECEILPNGDRRYNTLFRYVITENHMENGKFVIEGHHTQVNEISVSLRKRLLENGMPNEELQAFLNPKKEVNAT